MEELYELQNIVSNEQFSRYNSWQYCFEKFGNIHGNDDELALNLAFYLASWGMFRGKSGLLQKDYKLHLRPVQIIRSFFLRLRCDETKDITYDNVNVILKLKYALQDYYGTIEYRNNRNEVHLISPTDTLISKILLGTLGCVPAFDRMFISGVENQGENFSHFNEECLISLIQFVEHNLDDIDQFKNHVRENHFVFYPNMKIIDMYFWYLGYQIQIGD